VVFTVVASWGSEVWRREKRSLCAEGKSSEKRGGAVTAVVERESGAGCLLVGKENREFVFS
jgi:hypothetical protein